MAYQTVFKRYELKYIITKEQKEKILSAINEYMSIDKYGKTTIRNLYFDTANYRLIRRSIEKPDYKEKLRIRSYIKADSKSPVFVELKKKYKQVVYKRRIALTEDTALDWLCKRNRNFPESQISREIDYFADYYKNLRPTVFLSYEREAFYCKNGGDLRITFDENIKARYVDLSLKSDVWGYSLLEDEKVLLEVKSSIGLPFFLTEVLSREKIYKTSFSKYGTAYTKIILPKFKEEILYGNII